MTLGYLKAFLPGLAMMTTVMSPVALAQSVGGKSTDAPLTILGVHIGQAEAAGLSALTTSEFTPADMTGRKSRAALDTATRDLSFETEQGDRMKLQIGTYKSSVRPARIVAIEYLPARIDDGRALETRLKSKFGAPVATYTLGAERKLYVWERPAPEQSADFGPLMTISLTIGETPSLKISQFSRPALSGSVGASRSVNPVVSARRAAAVSGPSN